MFGKTLLFIVLFYFAFLATSAIGETSLSDYRLGSGDELRIQVFDEADLSMEIRLSDAGTISYPFIGELRVLGLTTTELESNIISGLKGGYLIDPKVNVAVLEYRPFYINGEVAEPGAYPFQPGLTLRKAIALAGGFTERASKSKIFAILEGEVGNPKPVQMAMDDPVVPGEIITVEQSFF
jgi:protein involved in polysaccharide export with SLBB domain